MKKRTVCDHNNLSWTNAIDNSQSPSLRINNHGLVGPEPCRCACARKAKEADLPQTGANTCILAVHIASHAASVTSST